MDDKKYGATISILMNKGNMLFISSQTCVNGSKCHVTVIIKSPMCEFNYNDLVEVFLKFLFYALFPKMIPHLWKKIIYTKKNQTKITQKIQQRST